MSVVVRFAPSPTGRIHVGNLRTALLNWMFAQQNKGRFLLRLDDTDVARSTEEFADGIREDLAWLGLRWDQEVRQSERFPLYDAAVEKLKASGRLYPAYESQDELELKRKRQLARGRPPVYDRAALKLTEADRAKLEAEGQKPHWRFKLETRDVVWDDLVRGEQHVDAASLSDPVLVRADGSYLYTLPSVVDDIDLGVTHVVRGEDHVANTAPQIQLFEALGAAPPAFGHHSLLVGAGGQALSKRDRSLAIEGLRQDGLEPLAVRATRRSSAPPIRWCRILPSTSWCRALPSASCRARRRGSTSRSCAALNAKLLHALPYEAVAPRLAEMEVGGGEALWHAVRANLAVLADIEDWWRVVAGPIEPVIADAPLCAQAALLLPPEPWDEATWGAWSAAVKQATGTKGKALFQPLRLALTGREHGPELKLLLPLIGRERALGAAQRQYCLATMLLGRRRLALGDARLLRRRRRGGFRRSRGLGFGIGDGAGDIDVELLRSLGRLRCGRRSRRRRALLRLSWRGRRLGLLVGGLDLGRVVFAFLAGAALHIGRLVFEGIRQLLIRHAVQRDGLLHVLAGIAVDIKLGRRGAACLALRGILGQAARIGLIGDREVEPVAGPDADGAVAAIRVDAAIDRLIGIFLVGLLDPLAAEPAEQSAAAAVAAHRLLVLTAAAAVAGKRIHELSLPPAIAAAAGDRGALLLQLVDLAARVLDAAIHLQAFRGADEAAAENQEAPLIATGIVHGRLGAPIHAGRVLDLAVDGGKLGAAAAAAGAGQFLLELHAARLLVVLRQRVAGAGERRAANREAARAAPDRRHVAPGRRAKAREAFSRQCPTVRIPTGHAGPRP